MTVTEVAEPPTSTEQLPPRRSRRRVTALLLTVGVACAAVGVLVVREASNSAADTAATGLPPNTARVTRQTLQDAQTVDGQLGYGTSRTATSRLAGTVTQLPDSGATITRGKPLYTIDDEPVILMYGNVPAYRPLTVGSEGPDVAQLERNLQALGYSGFTADNTYTSSTASAVAEWQDDLELDATGTVELGRVVFAPAAVRIDGLRASVGDPTGPGRPVLTYTGTAKEVTVELDAADQRLAEKGATVDVTLPDRSTTSGRVASSTTVIKPGGQQGEDPTTTVEVVVALTDQKAAEEYVLASVDVTFTAAERANVLTVPVAALLALSEGGFGVEVVDGTTTRYVPVRTGLFSGGRVEVSGSGIREGTVVGMPK
ncbi:efflux RND transporter periplasmic adaptor subunit [Cryptosporangium aurantiacum]|uniref:Multidrug efflux pump subunit AcrA (Membrane-fusion protein) n=1 Tax=Cryptosporangium aurantiacum TaxID=134849 RepID=A0A1M7NRI4_9ACTN|nr:peptidoglycan-binding protein [Cryptosporangium aurantiacum]SHN06677.1 Multidrug efflux pump subunit AcrA (membrane-fusion protein) [Cryptosporangium aurantiacum]